MKKRLAKKVISYLVVMCMLVSALPLAASAANARFSDMPNDWSTEALEKAVENGLLNGSDGMILPNNNLTRAEMAAIIVRAFGAQEEADISSYSDMRTNEWYYAEMAKAVKMGVFLGDGNNLYPDDSITREEAFTVLARAFELEGGDVSVLDRFTDKGEISDWALETIAGVVANDYAQGADGMITPKNNITRAEFAVLMDNFVKMYITEPGTYTAVVDGNLLIRANKVTLKNFTVKGDIVVGESVEKEGITLQNSSYEGRVINDANGDKVVESNIIIDSGGSSNPGGSGSTGGSGNTGGSSNPGGSGSQGGSDNPDDPDDGDDEEIVTPGEGGIDDGGEI